MNVIVDKEVQGSNFEAASLTKLVCPVTHADLLHRGNFLETQDGGFRYRISTTGIPLFAEEISSPEARRQQTHYDRVAEQYVENLTYPHTQEYLKYLDDSFLKELRPQDLQEVLELCCGRGELLTLSTGPIGRGVGVDISIAMLEFGKETHRNHTNFSFLQADATQLPFEDNSFSGVFIFGGIHHVPQREALFKEVFRVLRPGGRFYFREPVSDFFLWRIIRSVIYTLSPALDAETERPLIWEETVPVLESAGLRLKTWKTYGFLGFCFFMNSDVLVFNRLFRFIPGIRAITRLAAMLDDLLLKIPGFGKAGLQVIGVAEKSSL